MKILQDRYNKEIAMKQWKLALALVLTPPAPAAAVICFRCRGAEASCPVCHGAGMAALPDQAAALRLAAA